MNTYEPIFIVEIDGSELDSDISRHVEEFSYEDHDEKMDELRLVISDGDMVFMDHPQLQTGSSVRARWGYIGNLTDARECTIKSVSYTFPETGSPQLEITALDKGHNLTGRASRQCWSDKKISEVVSDIASKHNLSPVIDIPSGMDLKREFFSQGGQADMLYLRKIAEQVNCCVYVSNNELHFEEIKEAQSTHTFRYGEDGILISFECSISDEAGKGAAKGTMVSGINPLSKEKIKEESNGKSYNVNKEA